MMRQRTISLPLAVITLAIVVGCGSDALQPGPGVEIALEQVTVGELVFDVRTAGPAAERVSKLLLEHLAE